MSIQSPQTLAVESGADHLSDGPVDGNSRPKRGSRLRLYVRRFFRNKMAVVGLILFGALVLYALIGPWISPYSVTDTDFLAMGDPPGGTHWFGTNDAGQDLFVQSVYATQKSLIIALTVSTATTAIGAFIGAGVAYLGGRWERVVIGVVINFLLILPSFLILAILSSRTSGKWYVLVVILVLLGWMMQARVIWSLATSLREREFVTAARFMGVGGFTNVLRHIVPNIGSLLVINWAFGVIGTVMAETGLSFLGFGVKIPDVSLGVLLGEGTDALYVQPWLFYVPAAIVTILTVSMAFIADGLRDALDPNSAAGGRA